jgi:hypothetical protein
MGESGSRSDRSRSAGQTAKGFGGGGAPCKINVVIYYVFARLYTNSFRGLTPSLYLLFSPPCLPPQEVPCDLRLDDVSALHSVQMNLQTAPSAQVHPTVECYPLSVSPA